MCVCFCVPACHALLVLVTPLAVRARMHHKVVRHYFQSKRSNFVCMGRKSGSFSKQRGRNSVRIYFAGRP